jgi:AAA family ATP:ADP antiporter
LSIRESESKLVFRLFAFEFFHGAAIAIFFTSGISIFLKHLPTADLAKVFILSAGLLWITGFIYNKLENILPVRKLILSVLLFNGLCIVMFRYLLRLEDNNQLILFLLLGFFNVLYLLNNLEFWGLAAMLFDVRQSKRLFSIVSAGDIPSKMIGYIAALILTPIIGTENLLWVGVAFIIVSIATFPYLMRLKEVKELTQQEHHQSHHATESIKSLKVALTGNTLIRNLALTSFFSFCCFIIVNYIFYGYVKHSFTSNTELASFFAVFLVVIRLITLVVKLFVTNKLVDKIGLKGAMLITPIFLLLVCIIAIFYSSGGITESETFYVFGILAAITDVLRAAIQLPVMLATMQPLPTHKRLRGHTIIKGLMDPFAFLAMGILLLMLQPSGHEISFSLLGYILVGLLVCWIFFALLVDENYAGTLEEAIKKRTLNERFISITDNDSLEFLRNKLKNSNETEAFSILQLVAAQEVDKKSFFEVALKHPSGEVKQLALSLIEANNSQELVPLLNELLPGTSDTHMLASLIRTIAFLNKHADMSAFLEHEDKQVQKEALMVQLRQANDVKKKAALQKLNSWFDSEDDVDKINALDISGAVKDDDGTAQKILRLMQDRNEAVRRAAFKAAGHNRAPVLIDKLFKTFIKEDSDAYVLEALKSNAEYCLPLIANYLFKEKCEGAKSRQLISVVGKINKEAAIRLLEECASQFPSKSDILLPVIFQHSMHSKHHLEMYKKTIHECLNAAGNLLYQIDFLEQQKHQEILLKALQLELQELRNKCLNLFAFHYDAEKVRRAKIGFEMKGKEANANALELIQVTVPNEYSAVFTLIYENAPVRDKCLELHKSIAPPYLTEEILVKNILFDVGYFYSDWTKACALYNMKGKKMMVHPEFLKPFLHASNKILSETAEYILADEVESV